MALGNGKGGIMRMITIALLALGFVGAMAVSAPAPAMAQGYYDQCPVEAPNVHRRYHRRPYVYYRWYDSPYRNYSSYRYYGFYYGPYYGGYYGG